MIVLQVNGKVRAKFSVAENISEEELKARALKEPKALEWIGGKEVKKVVVAPKRLVNIVV